MVLITIVTGAYKPTYNWGASHCRDGLLQHCLLTSGHQSHGKLGNPQTKWMFQREKHRT